MPMLAPDVRKKGTIAHKSAAELYIEEEKLRVIFSLKACKVIRKDEVLLRPVCYAKLSLALETGRDDLQIQEAHIELKFESKNGRAQVLDVTADPPVILDVSPKLGLYNKQTEKVEKTYGLSLGVDVLNAAHATGTLTQLRSYDVSEGIFITSMGGDTARATWAIREQAKRSKRQGLPPETFLEVFVEYDSVGELEESIQADLKLRLVVGPHHILRPEVHASWEVVMKQTPGSAHGVTEEVLHAKLKENAQAAAVAAGVASPAS